MGADFLLVDEKSTPVSSSLTTPVNVCVSLFDGLAFAFHSKLDSYGSEPKVLVFTSINPQLVGATGIENYEKLIGDGSDQTPSSSKLPHAQKIEPLTISKLNQYVITFEPQIIEFLVLRHIKDGVILDARNVQQSYSERFLLSHAFSVIKPTLWRLPSCTAWSCVYQT
ncbi:unnamed protein product [Brassica oleracea var. botrytis]